MTKEAVILLVDDNQMDIDLALDAFAESKLCNNVQIVKSGEDALGYIFGEREYADRRRFPFPDLVLLDLKIPGIDGHEVLRRVKSAPVLKRLPIVVLTSSREESDLVRSYENYANSFLVKPVSFDGLQQVVRTIEDYWFAVNVGSPIEPT